VSKLRWLLLSAGILFVATAGAGPLGFVVAAAALGIPYLIGCMLHPRTIHGGCEGRGFHRSAMYPWASRRCRGCQGGLQVRHGARVIGLPHIRAEHAARTRAIAKARDERRWR
jgi:hypothetical protein